MNTKFVTLAVAAYAAFGAFAYNVSVGTYVVNAGKSVTVPIRLDSAAGLSYAGVTLSYDPQVLVITKAEAGTLQELMAEDFVAVDTNGTLSVTIFGSATNNVASGSGTIANVTFAVRDGTDALYSDLTLTDVSLGECTGVKDVSVGNPITTMNGMVRVMGKAAAVSRLENAQTVVAESTLGSLALKAGDAIQASDSQTNAVTVAGAVTSDGAIRVAAPVNDWASGTYELLKTPTAGLSFVFDGVTNAVSVTYSNATYYAVVTVPGTFEFVAGGGDDLSAGTRNQISKYADDLKKKAIAALDTTAADYAQKKALYENAKKVEVKGPAGHANLTATLADIGLSPALAPIDETGTLKLTYAMPKLELKSFDPSTGAVHFKVTPGEGNAIVSEIGTGYIHVYGTDDIGEPMTYVGNVGFDLGQYMKDDGTGKPKGEGVLNITLGSHTFLKVKIESVKKNDGDMED